MIRDRVASQWLQELLDQSSSVAGDYPADGEVAITGLLHLCRGLAQPDAAVDPVILVQRLRFHDDEMLQELLEEPECFKHQDWAAGFELLLNVLVATTPAAAGPVSLPRRRSALEETYVVK